MAWQDSLAWVLAQDPRWVVVFFGALAALWLVRRVVRFWRGREDLGLVMACMALAFPLGAVMLAHSRHGDERSRRIFFVLAALGTPLYLAPLRFAVHPVVLGVSSVLLGGVFTIAFGLLQRSDRVEEPRIEDRLYQLGLATLDHMVAADGRTAVAIDPSNQTVILATIEQSFPRRIGFGKLRSVDVFCDDKPVESAAAVVKGPVELRIVTDDLTDPRFTMLLAKPGKVRARDLARIRSEAFIWRNLLRKLRTREAGAKLPIYLRELHVAGVINESEYRSLLDRTARI